MKSRTLDINQLLELCKSDNRLAQLEVYRRYQQAMFNAALRIVKDRALAEDLMQESFLKAFQRLDTFRGEAEFGAWLKRIVVNNSLTAYRKLSRYAEVSLDENADWEVENEAEAQAEVAAKAETVLKAMEEIHESYRMVLNLHYIEGYGQEEISAMMNISHGNCRTLLFRAKESLRKKLCVNLN